MITVKDAILARKRNMFDRLDVEGHREQTFWARYLGAEDEDDHACFWLMTGWPG